VSAPDPDTPVLAEVASLTWYHTIELPGGVVTPGEYDTRAVAARVPLPADLSGARCLDVGTHDGFWAFEMERRGASEVVAIDLDDPRRIDFSEPVPVLSGEQLTSRVERIPAFWCAHAALRSRVVRHDLSVYDLPGSDLGPFDFAFLGTLLLHLHDPLSALGAIRRVLSPGGMLLVNDAISLELSLLHPRAPAYSLTLLPGRPFWWLPNAAGIARYLEKTGYTLVRSGRPYLVPNGPGFARPAPPRTRKYLLARAVHNRGMPHAWALGRAP
jgi:tRNA (mo5U34)-methyltransferase